jgi:hypothetical protein
MPAPRPREILADVDLALGEAAMQVLRIGVDGDEFHALHLRIHHVIHCIASRTADADHADACEGLDLRFYALGHRLNISRQICLLWSTS